jgi:sulfur transfer protein SufE
MLCMLLFLSESFSDLPSQNQKQQRQIRTCESIIYVNPKFRREDWLGVSAKTHAEENV